MVNAKNSLKLAYLQWTLEEPVYLCLSDFGTARTANQEEDSDEDDVEKILTRAAGTLPFMSPQHIDNLLDKKKVEPTLKDDIYAYGGTIFRLITGTHPLNYKKEISEVGKGRQRYIEYEFNSVYPVSFALVELIHESLLYDADD